MKLYSGIVSSVLWDNTRYVVTFRDGREIEFYSDSNKQDVFDAIKENTLFVVGKGKKLVDVYRLKMY